MAFDIERIQGICFDVDGTLCDTDNAWVESLARRLRLVRPLIRGGDVHAAARRLVMFAETPANAIYQFLDHLHLDDEAVRLASLLARRKSRRKPHHFLPVPGVVEMLERVKLQFPIAVVSARDADTTRAFLEQFDLLRHFYAIATSQTCVHTKPFPHPILWAAEKMGVLPENCLMVGDTTVDIKAGKAAGAQTVGVLCGFGSEDELRRAGADLILPGTAALLDILKITG